MWRVSERKESCETSERVRAWRLASSVSALEAGRGIRSISGRRRSEMSSSSGTFEEFMLRERLRRVRAWWIMWVARAVWAVINLGG